MPGPRPTASGGDARPRGFSAAALRQSSGRCTSGATYTASRAGCLAAHWIGAPRAGGVFLQDVDDLFFGESRLPHRGLLGREMNDPQRPAGNSLLAEGRGDRQISKYAAADATEWDTHPILISRRVASLDIACTDSHRLRAIEIIALVATTSGRATTCIVVLHSSTFPPWHAHRVPLFCAVCRSPDQCNRGDV